MEHVQLAAFEAGLPEIRRSPPDLGSVELIVRRPAAGEREELAEATLDWARGLLGDLWPMLPSPLMKNGAPDPDAQLTLMNARVATLVAGDPDRRRLAGDQLYVDFDLSRGNLPAGTRLEVGSALIEVTDQPHRGCGKFGARFGVDALRFVNSPAGRELNLRGVNAKVIAGGVVRPGDSIQKAPAARLLQQRPQGERHDGLGAGATQLTADHRKCPS
jgi:hypothetical protein